MNMKTYISSAFAGAFLIGMATAALAVTGEYDNMCTMGLASGKDIKTDCSVNSQIQGKTYCFGSQSALTQFMAVNSEMSPRCVVICGVCLQDLPKMCLTPDYHMVEAFTAD